MTKYNIKLSDNDLSVIFSFLKKGVWENVNDTIQNIYTQKVEQDKKIKDSKNKKTKEK